MARLRRGNRDLIKEINRNLALNLIKSRGPISRTDIARLSSLSLATVSSITADFIASGQEGSNRSDGGDGLMLSGRVFFSPGFLRSQNEVREGGDTQGTCGQLHQLDRPSNLK